MRFSILTILILLTTTLFGQKIKKCDGTVLSTIADKIGKAQQKEITDFLLTFGQECRNNVEFQSTAMNYFFPFWTSRQA